MNNRIITKWDKGATLFILLLLSIGVHAQMSDFCATDAKVEAALKSNLQRKLLYEQQEQLKRSTDQLNFAGGYAQAKNTSSNYILPVVVHIIHENGVENVSDAQVHDAIRVLNNDFRKLNSDSNQVVPFFRPFAADCQIEFRLAQIDPDGNCTNGIDRIYSYQTNIGDDGSKLNPWPETKYYNIWVVKNISPGGIAGYAYYPGTAPFGAEGVIILHTYFGSIGSSSVYNSRVLTHETGHYLDLPHVWGSTNSPGIACGDDGVGDTPITKGWTSCNTNGSICASGVLENVQNYMEYSYCTKMFTWGQKARMIAALNSPAGSRNSLWIPATLAATGVNNTPSLCAADFVAFPRSTTLCAGESITFSDNSFNSHPSSWQWSFPGGTLVGSSTLTDSMPVVQYSNPGSYDVSLTVSDGLTSATEIKYNYVEVESLTASYNSNFYSSSFENIQIPNVDWSVNDIDGGGMTWQVANNAGSSGSASAFMDATNSLVGDADELISPSINLTAIASPYFTFKYAFAPGFNAGSDQLIVSLSHDCGKTWSQRKLLSGTALATASPTVGSFLPTASQWKQSVVSIVNMANQANVRIRFKFINGGGNNLFLDDINITSALGVNEINSSSNNISLSPNPYSESAQLSFFLKEASEVKIELCDVVGKKIKLIAQSNFPTGNNSLTIDREGLLPGFYFMHFTSGSERSTLKISVR